MTEAEEFAQIVYTLGESADTGRKEYGEQWSEAMRLAYNDAVSDLLPLIPLSDHDRFSRALFNIRIAAHRETGMDTDPNP